MIEVDYKTIINMILCTIMSLVHRRRFPYLSRATKSPPGAANTDAGKANLKPVKQEVSPMAKLAVCPSPVNSAPPTLPHQIRRQFTARATCPWCGSPMYLNRAGTRLQCADAERCGGVRPVR